MKQSLSITRKELSSYFGSPMALIFVGVFLAATLFAFFWVNAFFARGIADVRPLFQWMPILMIFLVAALTMRMWSEEQRSGTMEVLLTLPVSNWQLVLGKFLAVMALVALSLALTLFLPITVSLFGNLDWGPVVGGYLAALLLAAAYAAIGLFISSRTDNQIVALILSALVCGLFYLVGARGVTDFLGRAAGDILRALGAGSRFESIERGVIDLRDLVYYLSLAAAFLVLNTWSLDRKRWSFGPRTAAYRRAMTITTVLLEVNLVALNVWLYPLSGLRLDLTSQKQYSLSQATRDLLGSLQEPLLIRGYFSEKTHPLLAPLVPQVEDMLREYEIAGHGKVVTDIVDPIQSPDKETEANQTYGIRPTPLQVSGRYEASVINAYFDILIRYGDQNVTLNFRDLIQVASNRDGTADVQLRNLEYDLTRSIKKVVYGFQSVDAVLAAMNTPVTLTLFATRDSLPQDLKTAPDTVQKVAANLQNKSNGKFTFEAIDPDAPNAKVTRQQLLNTYHLQPISASLFSPQTYYLDMVLQAGDKSQVVSLPADVSETNVQSAIEAALKRSSTGFLKVIGLWTPPQQPTQDMFGQAQQPFTTFNQVPQMLSQDYTVQSVDLSSGQVPPNVDVLVLIAPQGMDDKARYAVDQYLMRGGSVVVAAGAFALDQPDQMTGALSVKPLDNGLADMLESYGIRIEKSLVLDPQNEPFPVQVQRTVNDVPVNEIQALNYPFFVDVRPDAMDRNSPIVANVPAVTLNWASPLTIDAEKNKGRQVSVLLKSSKQSWVSSNTLVTPDMQKYPELGFPVEGTRDSRPLAVSVTGAFQSYFKGKPSPLTASNPVTDTNGAQNQPAANTAPSMGTIEESPANARLVVIGSSDFLNDIVFQLSSSLNQDRYLNSLQFFQNAVDWSVEDMDLLSIRSRGSTTRVLAPMSQSQETMWEVINYVLAAAGLAGVGLLWYLRKRRERPMDLDTRAREAITPAGSRA